MAEQGSQEKTEDATPKRLREARKKGQVAKSRDLNTVFVLVVVFVVLAIGAPYFKQELEQAMRFCFDLIAHEPLTGADLLEASHVVLLAMAKILVPILAAGLIAAAGIDYLQVGGVFSTEPLTPKFEKLNPIEGLKNMFKMVTLIELIKNIAKLAVVFYIAYQTVFKFLDDILLSSRVDIIQSVTLTGGIVYSFFIRICVVFLVIAFLDFGVQRWNFLKNMRMSKEEIKREYKEDEGDPHIKGERRRQHREMVFGDVRKNVKRADAVVSNPTHVAVAIKYDREDMAAPEVLVKGQRQFAEMILKIARDENVPIVRNIPLAWSLLQVEEGDAIPQDLYDPVAEVLCLVYEMKENTASRPSATKTTTSAQQNPKPPSRFDPLA